MMQKANHFLTQLYHSRYFFPVTLFLVLRLWLLVAASLSIALIPVPVEQVRLYYGMTPLESGLDKILWSPWQRWDTIWYAKIAEQGYSPDDLSTAFFPLLPLLIKLIAPFLLNNSIAAGVLIASIAALASFILFFSITSDRFGEAAAKRALFLLASFPTAFFLFAAYTESLFLALALASFICARSSRWEWAGVLGGLAALTRPQGALLVLPLLIEFVIQYRHGAVSFVRGVNLLAVVVGGLAFEVYLALQFQNPLIWFQVQSHWHQSAMPWQALGSALGVVFGAKDWVEFIYSVSDPFAALLFLGLMFWGVARLELSLAAYIAVIILPPLFNIATYEPLLPMASMSRYVLSAFPGFILMGQASFLAQWSKPIAGLCFLFQNFWLFLFTQWIFVG